MNKSIFDSFFSITEENSVATVVIEGDRYGLILQHMPNEYNHWVFQTFEFSPSININKKYSNACVEQVNKDDDLRFAEINCYRFIDDSSTKISRKHLLRSINFDEKNCILMSYNIKYTHKIDPSIVSNGKEYVYSNKVTSINRSETIIPSNSKRWVTEQLKLLGVDFYHVRDPEYSSTKCVIS